MRDSTRWICPYNVCTKGGGGDTKAQNMTISTDRLGEIDSDMVGEVQNVKILQMAYAHGPLKPQPYEIT